MTIDFWHGVHTQEWSRVVTRDLCIDIVYTRAYRLDAATQEATTVLLDRRFFVR